MELNREEHQSGLWILFKYRLILIFLGCFLLLLGNTLPWPCIPGSLNEGECYPPLITHDYTGISTIIVIAGGILLLLLAISRLKAPFNVVVWLSVWLLAYLLVVARLRSDSFAGRMYFPLVDVNKDLGGPTFLVLPTSLIVFWLTLRPQTLRRKWRRRVIAVQIVLICLTLVFFAVDAVRSELHSRLPEPEAWLLGGKGQFGPAPLLILVGSLMLLAVEFVENRRESGTIQSLQAAAEPAIISRETLRVSRGVNLAGFWSALLTAGSTILLFVSPWIILPVTSPSRVIDAGTVSLLNVLATGLSLLGALGFIILMACIAKSAPPGKTTWSWIGMVFAILSAVCTVLQISPISPSGLDFRILALPFLTHPSQFLFWNAVFMSLAGLCALPVFGTSRIEQVIRWGLAIYAGSILISSFEIVLSGYSQLAYIKIAAQLVIFPVTTGLMAIVFRRAPKLTQLA